jgi:hypothetical protein
MLADLQPGTGSSFPEEFVRAGNYLYFIANSAQYGKEVFKIALSNDGNTAWTGNSSTSWSDAANWTNGIPTPGSEVTIPAGRPRYPVVTTSITVKRLQVSEGAGIQVSAGAIITVTGQ